MRGVVEDLLSGKPEGFKPTVGQTIQLRKLFRDLGDPDRYLETFVVPSWGEHLRQHVRVTVDDQALEARRNAFLQPGVAPVTAHLIAAHVFDGRSAAEPPGVEPAIADRACMEDTLAQRWCHNNAGDHCTQE